MSRQLSSGRVFVLLKSERIMVRSRPVCKGQFRRAQENVRRAVRSASIRVSPVVVELEN